ncbi:MAG: ATP-binding protein [Actinomycetota bacterium]|nr:ATP-binding protein [Actinomycetota bacterium]
MTDARTANRPSRLALSNWPVRWKVLAIAAVPLVLAGFFGGLRIHASVTEAAELRSAAERAEMVPAVADYMAALEDAMVTATEGGDTGEALSRFGSVRADMEQRLDATDVDDSARLATNTLLDFGQDLLDDIAAGAVDLRGRITAYTPLLITAETAITGLVSADDASVRAEGDALARAVGARGQMAMQQMLVTSGAVLPEPDLRSAMVTIAGTEPSAVSAMGAYLGGATDQAATLRSEMVTRMLVLADPASVVLGNPDLLASQQVTRDIADGIIADTTQSIPATVTRQADEARTAAIRDAALVAAAIVVALLLVTLVARTLVRPLRTLRDSALRVAHEDLAREVERVRSDGETPPVQPIAVHTSEEVGQVAHAVDELHEQAVLLAAEQARLQLQVADMFETLSRRNQTLVDQQLSLIDRLERDEEDPERLDNLFRLDHLAARMRRNGANLMVLVGARVRREQAGPISVTALVHAAASEVEDYQRIQAVELPDAAVTGAVAGDLVHLLAELLDNALRYSPPHHPVRVSAVPTGSGGLVLEISDTGLGMTDADLRIANTRLQTGGEVNPYTARHMGLFVVGRLAALHGVVVRLRSSAEGAGSGTTAGVYVPAEVLLTPVGPQPPAAEQVPARSDWAEVPVPVAAPAAQPLPEPVPGAAQLLPQRRPGASGMGGPEPADPVAQTPRSDVAAFFTARPEPAPEPAPAPADTDDAIYQSMLSEWLVDPHELAESPDLDWQSVWDHGWSAAAAAEQAPVGEHTAEGLPVRRPGARLVPGAAAPDEAGQADRSRAAAQSGPARDPEAVRASIGSHFGGVHAARSRTQETGGSHTE